MCKKLNPISIYLIVLSALVAFRSEEKLPVNRVITLKKDSKNSVYKPKLNLQPGDTIRLSGHYRLIYLDSVFGTKEKPIIIINKDSVSISGYASYCFIIRGKHFKILGNGNPKYKHGITLSGFDATYTAQAFGLTTSSNYEIANVKITKVSVGFLQNGSLQSDLSNIYIHDNYIVELDNPKNLGRSEGVYFGSATSVSKGRMLNVRIEDNIFKNLSGDGIQCAQGDFTIKNNIITGWAKAKLAKQRNGILIGEGATSIIEGNILDGGSGTAYANFGGGEHIFKNNVIKNVNVSNLTKEDIIFLQGRGLNFSINFSNNQFVNCKPNRKIINNVTINTPGSVFINNHGISITQVKLNNKDKWKVD